MYNYIDYIYYSIKIMPLCRMNLHEGELLATDNNRTNRHKASREFSMILATLVFIFFQTACSRAPAADANSTYGSAAQTSASAVPSSEYQAPGASKNTVASKNSTVSVSSLSSSEEEEFIVTDALRERVNKVCRDMSVTGMSIAAFKGDNLFYKQSYGYSDKTLMIAANENTKYRIASISKTITGIMAMKLISDGKFSLDTPVSDYLGVNLDSPQYPNNKITVKQLLTHTSGIMDSPSYLLATKTPMPLGTLLSYGGIHAQFCPGTMYLYSNFGAGLVSGVIERATGERFYDYADKALFTPLNMDAGFLRTKIGDTENLAQIYLDGRLTVNVKRWLRVESLYDAIPIGQMYMLGQSDLIISATDLAAFAMALAGDGTAKGYTILPPKAVNEMNTVQFTDGKSTRGLALNITDNLVRGRTLHGHLGQAYGMISGMYYDPKDQTGVVFITNGCSQNKNASGNFDLSEALVNAVYSEFFDKNNSNGSSVIQKASSESCTAYTAQESSSGRYTAYTTQEASANTGIATN